MRAVVCREYGPPENLRVEELPEPVAGERDVVVEVRAAGVNFADLLILRNRYQLSATPPFVPGSELAGVVRAVGAGVTNVRPGDRVFGQTFVGAFAERAVLTEDGLTLIPEGVDFRVAAAFTVTYTTAYDSLRSVARLEKGETLLVLAAAGGVGLAAVDVGRALGARVVAAASSEEKLAVCREYGAAETIDYSTESLKERAKQLTGGRGVDVVLDPVGGPLAEQAVRATGWRGRYVSLGFASGEIPRIPLNLLVLKGCELHGFNIATFRLNEPGEAERNRKELLELLASGAVRPRIDSVHPLEQASRALTRVAERRAIGKVLVEPRRSREHGGSTSGVSP